MELHRFFEGEDFKAALPNEHRCWVLSSYLPAHLQQHKEKQAIYRGRVSEYRQRTHPDTNPLTKYYIKTRAKGIVISSMSEVLLPFSGVSYCSWDKTIKSVSQIWHHYVTNLLWSINPCNQRQNDTEKRQKTGKLKRHLEYSEKFWSFPWAVNYCYIMMYVLLQNFHFSDMCQTSSLGKLNTSKVLMAGTLRYEHPLYNSYQGLPTYSGILGETLQSDHCHYYWTMTPVCNSSP